MQLEVIDTYRQLVSRKITIEKTLGSHREYKTGKRKLHFNIQERVCCPKKKRHGKVTIKHCTECPHNAKTSDHEIHCVTDIRW